MIDDMLYDIVSFAMPRLYSCIVKSQILKFGTVIYFRLNIFLVLELSFEIELPYCPKLCITLIPILYQ